MQVAVAKIDHPDPVTLTCDSLLEFDGVVTWTHLTLDGVNQVLESIGHDLKVKDVDTPLVGEYSCWNNNKKLASIYLFLDAEDQEEESDSFISCWAKSYNCTFSCNWTHSEFTAVRMGLGHNCSADESSCSWVSPSSGPHSDGGFQFELNHSLSPFGEESNMLEVTAEAINKHSYLRQTKRFFLRDIIQPDSPTIVKCRGNRKGLKVTTEPPTSWATPYSYFPLEHEIEYHNKDNGQVGRSTTDYVPIGISHLRVRSRDPLLPSSWSEWTPWKNVTS
ncbi:interleukin-12 subunit beta [Aplochiton taeniatus]